MQDWIARTEDYVREKLPTDATGHDWHHVFRVRRNALTIGKPEGADLLIVELAALLHDIADHKFHGGDEKAGPSAARTWLASLNVPTDVVEHICQIISRL